jgi:GxxExxY protein
LESVYEVILARELEKRRLRVQCQVVVPIIWEGLRFDEGIRVDCLLKIYSSLN